ncbi:MAG: DUF2267 domain-containing protein [Sphingomonadaceae bacterium]
MKYDQFVAAVRQGAFVDSDEEAEAAIRATLETLSDVLPWEEANALAGQLPEEMASYVRESAAGESLSLDDFLNRIAYREGVDVTVADIHAQVVLQEVKAAVSPGTIGKILGRLPEGYHRLFQPAGRRVPRS